MSAQSRNGPPSSVVCLHFEADDVAALRSLLGLLGPHLKRPWQVLEQGRGDLRFVNLDHGGQPPDDGTPTVGCSVRPRAHPHGTIHRPWRAAGVLAALNEHGETASSEESRTSVATMAAGVAAGMAFEACSYRLLDWPLQFERWPRSWWAVLAAIGHVHRDVEDIARRTGVAKKEVECCLLELQRQDLLERRAGRSSATSRIEPAATGGWRDLVSRIGRRLGFER